jgi:CDP-diacylglycerol--glycerol-3-phosphate 3-phosphatidyltransferase
MKILVNTITASRVFAALSLLLIAPMVIGFDNPTILMTVLFYVIYTYCVASDIADGHIARRAKVTTNFGALFDSIADLIFIAVVLFIFVPVLFQAPWTLYLVGLVLVTRFIAFGIGYAKYKTLTLLHTYSNKAAGLVMAAFPIFFMLFGLPIGFSIIFAAAYLSALEEFFITIFSKKLDRNIVSIFHLNKEELTLDK